MALEFEVIAIMDKLISLGITLTIYLTLPILAVVGLFILVSRRKR